jgi:hypothetical protein
MLAAWVALGATACGRHVYLGSLGDGGGGTGGAGILWRATFEPGDLSEWLADGNGGIYMDNLATAPAVTQDVAHRGAHAGIAAFAPVTVTSFSYLYREQPSPPEAYYGAWFLIPTTLQVGSWLSLHHFGYHRTAGSADTMPLFDFNVYPGSDGTLFAHLFDPATVSNIDQTDPVPVPVGRWVHFEIFLRKAADATGRITIWQDGALILDVPNLLTAPTEWLQWDAGGGSNDVTPTPAAVYLDDATISTTRVGVGQ